METYWLSFLMLCALAGPHGPDFLVFIYGGGFLDAD